MSGGIPYKLTVLCNSVSFCHVELYGSLGISSPIQLQGMLGGVTWRSILVSCGVCNKLSHGGWLRMRALDPALWVLLCLAMHSCVSLVNKSDVPSHGFAGCVFTEALWSACRVLPLVLGDFHCDLCPHVLMGFCAVSWFSFVSHWDTCP